MNKFRIVQTQPLTSVLPYEIEECHRAWFLPWPLWRRVQERNFTGRRFMMTPRRFQTTQEAQLFIEQLLILRVSQEAQRVFLLEERHERRQLPRVVQVLHPTVPA